VNNSEKGAPEKAENTSLSHWRVNSNANHTGAKKKRVQKK